ncbi:hypothetical protein PRIPAC_72431 [Pristionchus pacificus]|uniref:Membrane transporter n=1 Tax=Pristionchus pacificus TaxID=54126 RepID=A0A2A6BG03_PRIPA|nr:hypothetical protein PRIPAC_72431 [Pristionchus pacificus]|eukprot:PDM64812.1 membrane transporter [Pristionchus pacificus]
MQWTPPLWSWRSMRLKIAICIGFALYSAVSMRSSLSMGIVCMVNSTAFAKEEFVDLPSEEEVENAARHGIVDGCPAHIDENTTAAVGYNGHLMWPPGRQTMLFSANYYGALVTMLVSGTMADKFGPTRILMVAISILILLTLAAPTLAEFNYWVYYGSRVLLGMCEGFVIPCANSLGGRWFPPNEKSSMAALYTSGNQIAAGSSGLIGAWLCKVPFLGGWPVIFYMFGLIGIIWFVTWTCVVSDHPSENRWIRSEEKEYLEGRVAKRNTKGTSIPWSKILRSREVHACLFCNFTFSFMVSINQNFLPLYFKEELFLPLSMNGLYTVVPFLTQLIMKNILASAADHLKSSGKMTPTHVVKLFQGTAAFGTALILVCLALFPSCHQPWLAAVFMFLYGIFFSGGICGFFTSLISIAPSYTGTLSSMSMGFGQIASIISTNTVAAITYQGWPHKWLIIFFIGAALQVFSGIFFLTFGSGEPADWGKIDQRAAKMSMIDDVLLNDLPEPFSDDDDEERERGDTFETGVSPPQKRSIDRIRKISREAALVRWTLSSGGEETIMEEEEEEGEATYYLNGRKCT